MKVIIVGVEPFSLLNFRGDLIKSLLVEGYSVTAVASCASPEDIDKVEALGCKYIDIKINRTGLNPIDDLKFLLNLIILINSEKPTHILPYTIKPVIWSGIALYLFPTVKFSPMITGLGYAFGVGGLKRKILSYIATLLYSISMKRANSLIFQNKHNMEVFAEKGIIKDFSKSYVINGSGVNLEKFSYSPPNILYSKLKFLMIARLLRDKGIHEYLNAAKAIKNRYPTTEFILVGPIDKSPNSFDFQSLKKYEHEGVIKYLGPTKDVRSVISNTNIFVLPSYHEGSPRTVLEAMAMGRPIITTNTPGLKKR